MNILLLYYNITQTDFMLPWVWTAIDHRRCRNVMRTAVTHSAAPLEPLFLFLTRFNFTSDLLLNRGK